MENEQRNWAPYFQPLNLFIVANYNSRWQLHTLHLQPNETPPAQGLSVNAVSFSFDFTLKYIMK